MILACKLSLIHRRNVVHQEVTGLPLHFIKCIYKYGWFSCHMLTSISFPLHQSTQDDKFCISFASVLKSRPCCKFDLHSSPTCMVISDCTRYFHAQLYHYSS